MKEFSIAAKTDNLTSVLAFVDGELEKADCPLKTQMQVDIAVEEIFVNIASYAYPSGTGDASVRMEVSGSPAAITLVFTDRGIPYDPLEKADPDVTLSAEERQIGGLGIYLVKKSMDDMQYERRDGQNILTIKKYI